MVKKIITIALVIILTGCTTIQKENYIEHRCLDNKLYEVTPQKVKALRDTEGNFLDCPYQTF